MWLKQNPLSWLGKLQYRQRDGSITVRQHLWMCPHTLEGCRPGKKNKYSGWPKVTTFLVFGQSALWTSVSNPFAEH